MSKQILAIFLMFFLASGIIRETENHQQLNHQQIQDGFGVGGAAIGFTEFMIGLFPVTCKKGYKRGVTVTVQNLIPKVTLSLKGLYQDSGKVLERGAFELATKQKTAWYFVKHSGSSTGSCGVNVWQIGNTNKGLIFFYENPWSSWNFQGVCLRDGIKFPANPGKLPESYLKGLYDQLYNGHPVWPKDCILFDNTKEKSTDWRRDQNMTISGYKILASAQYKYLDGQAFNDCYTAAISARISL